MAKVNLVLATARGPLQGRGVPCMYHQNRVCMHGSKGEDCRFWHVRDFNQVPQCEFDRKGIKCVKGHSCTYFHETESNQGLMGKQEGPIPPYPPRTGAHDGVPPRNRVSRERSVARQAKGARLRRGLQDSFFRFGWRQCMKYYGIEADSSSIGREGDGPGGQTAWNAGSSAQNFGSRVQNLDGVSVHRIKWRK